MLAALVATLAIAVTASVFAIWPAVADAPWEKTTRTLEASPHPRSCDEIHDTGWRSLAEFDLFLENCITPEPSPLRRRFDPREQQQQQQQPRDDWQYWERQRQQRETDKRLDDIEKCLDWGWCSD